MADKDVDKLDKLFHEQPKFVHMSGTWKKAEELEIIKSGSIWYKEAKVNRIGKYSIFVQKINRKLVRNTLQNTYIRSFYHLFIQS